MGKEDKHFSYDFQSSYMKMVPYQRKDRGSPLSLSERECEGRSDIESRFDFDMDVIVHANMLDDA